MREACIYDFTFYDDTGALTSLAPYKGKFILIVNTAVLCGFATQYPELSALQNDFAADLSIIAFPSNQFYQQPEVLTEKQAACRLDLNLSFPLMQPVVLNGTDAHPLFAYLKRSQRGIFGTHAIKWNFTKFLVGRDGEVLKRFAPNTSIASIRKTILRYVSK